MSPEPTEPPKAATPRTNRGLVLITLAVLAIASTSVLVFYLRSNPSDEARRSDATANASQGRWANVRSALVGLRQPTHDDRLLRATASHAIGLDGEAMADLKEIPRDGVAGARRALLLAQIEQSRHRARPMEAALLEAIHLDPGLAQARRLLIYLYGLQERRAELMEQFAALVERGPVTVELVLHWCLSRGAIGDPAENLSALLDFVAEDPDDRASRLALAEVQRRLGELDDATRTLVPLTSGDSDALAIRAQIEFDRGDNTAAMALLADSPKDHAALARVRGRRALAQRIGPLAVSELKASDAAEPENPDTLFVLAQALRLVGNKEEADRVAARAAAHTNLRAALVEFSNSNKASPEIFRKLAVLNEAVDRKPEAIAWYKLAIAANPLDTESQKALFRLKAK